MLCLRSVDVDWYCHGYELCSGKQAACASVSVMDVTSRHTSSAQKCNECIEQCTYICMCMQIYGSRFFSVDPGSAMLAPRSRINEGSCVAWACLDPCPVKARSVMDSVFGSQLFPQSLALARNWGKDARGRGLGPSFTSVQILPLCCMVYWYCHAYELCSGMQAACASVSVIGVTNGHTSSAQKCNLRDKAKPAAQQCTCKRT